MQIYLYNTLNKKKELFVPDDPNYIKMYVCGPTVYNYPHVGNARSVVVYDVLFNLLKYIYPSVNYVRNITDVDDKIIAAAEINKKSISEITTYYTSIFENNMEALGCSVPTYQPKATQHILEMVNLIQSLVNNNHAYVGPDGSVYFSIESYTNYGRLSGKKIEDLIAGSRVEVDPIKRNPGDFLLWKPSKDQFWESPWGRGRPGWHIECSAMSYAYLGENFDIHGGGVDLQFPHHENEIAQSCCAFPGAKFAKYWVHNGFVTVEGEKMSKSIGNIVTVQDLLNNSIKGEAIRFVLLSTHYRKPLNWTSENLKESLYNLGRFYRAIEGINANYLEEEIPVNSNILAALCDDLNTPQAVAVMHELVNQINTSNDPKHKLFLQKQLKYSANLLLGLLKENDSPMTRKDAGWIEQLIEKRLYAKQTRNYKEADALREELERLDIILEDKKDGSTKWYTKQSSKV